MFTKFTVALIATASVSQAIEFGVAGSSAGPHVRPESGYHRPERNAYKPTKPDFDFVRPTHGYAKPADHSHDAQAPWY